jgi:hypothetical protein
MYIPQVSSPFICLALESVIGSKEILSIFSAIKPSAKRLSVTVGIVEFLSGDKEPT